MAIKYWLIPILLLVGVVFVSGCTSEMPPTDNVTKCTFNGITMTSAEAINIIGNSECAQYGTIDEARMKSHDATCTNTGEWSVYLYLNPEIEAVHPTCNYVCNVNITSKQATGNWACTGVPLA